MSGIQPVTNDDKLWAGLAYAGWGLFLIPTVAIFVMKKEESEYVKFHALQGILVGLLVFVLSMGVSIITGIIPYLGWIVGSIIIGLISLLSFVLWLYLMYVGFTGKDFELPVLGQTIRQNWM